MRNLSLFELNSLVADLVSTTLPQSFWVEAELAESRENGGHLYLSLTQKDETTNTPIAQASAKCWRSAWLALREQFQRVTGQNLRAGMKLLIRVHAQFHQRYGFSWIVDDINPEFTLGDMARQRLEIIRRLKDEGVFDLQHELTLPRFAQRIAVISSETAAGYGDFVHQLQNNIHNLSFTPRLFPAVMQGEQVEHSVISALNEINKRCEQFDCVVIIRGGGATADLTGFDTLQLAENVANFPLPIITGIGHERDQSILDMISHTCVKTPTAAASFLTDHLLRTWNDIGEAESRMTSLIRNRIDDEQQRIERIISKTPALVKILITQQQARIQAGSHRLSTVVNELLDKHSRRLDNLTRSLPLLVRNRITQQQHRLELIQQRVQANNPDRLLKLGYSITLHNGRVVRSASTLKSGDTLLTRFSKGSIESIVKQQDL